MRRFLLNVTAEPSALHAQAGFAVHVVPDTRLAPDATAGRTLLTEFFALNAPELYAVTFDLAGGAQAPIPLQSIPLAPIDAGSAIMAWLGRRSPAPADRDGDGDGDKKLYWVGHGTNIAETDGDANYETVLQDDTVIPAMDLLRASLNWAAPVPQRAGLVHLALRPDPVGANELLLIFPWWDAVAPQAVQVTHLNGDAIIAAPAVDEAVLLTVTAGATNIGFISAFVKPFAPIYTGDTQNGWVAAGRLGSNGVRVMRRIRAELSGTLDAFAPLTAFPITGTDAAANATAAAYATWLRIEARKLLFDRIDLAVQGRGRFRDGLRDILAGVAAEDGINAELTDESGWLPVVPPASDFAPPEIKDVLEEAQLFVEDAEIVGADPANAQPPPTLQTQDGFKDLELALANLSELAIALTDPDQLRAIVTAYMRLATGGWRTTLATSANDALFLSRADAAFDAYFKGPGANLAAELREDAADVLMDHFHDILIPHLKATPPDTPMRAALDEFDWMWTRVNGNLPAGGLRTLAPLATSGLQEHLTAAYGLSVDGILNTNFVPDQEPQPLTIIATDELDPTNFERITSQITGFGVVIGARHPNYDGLSLHETYAHFNAAELTFEGGTEVPMAIEPITPAPNYGQLELSINYTGVPQIGRLVATADHDSATGGVLDLPQPYGLDHVDYPQASKGLMRLAYGFEYHALPYYISNSGTLPEQLRADGSLILSRIDLAANLPTDTNADIYLRTTPVATVSVTNATASPHPGIGYIPPDVAPIGPELLKTSALRDRIVDPSLLLLGHPDTGGGKLAPSWKPEFRRGAVLTISAPRVSFDDFDRWVANPLLLNHQSGVDDLSDTGLTLPIVDIIENARDIFEDVQDVLSAELVNRLPDPAVRKLRVRLQVFDSLWQVGSKLDQSVDIDVNPYRNLPDNGTIPDTVKSSGPYAKFIRAIDRDAQFQLTIKVAPDAASPSLMWIGDILTATLRPGDICALTVCPMVPKAHYENGSLRAIHPEFLNLDKTVEADLGDMICLRGTSILLEAMDMPRISELAENPGDNPLGALKVVPEGRDRGYTFRLCPSFDDVDRDHAIFRAFSDVDLITQRWRTTGQPIPDWINPAIYADGDSPVAVVPYDANPAIPGDLGTVGRFESGAFFGRALYDGERRRIRLPAFLPDSTEANAVVLDRVTWPSPAATYLRYAQIYRSRYIGAMASGNGAIPAIGAKAGDTAHPLAHRFTTRVAILADISGNTIVTPQVRHILPSLAGSRDQDAPLPYVLSLNERPFDQFGLADRILPQVTTIQTFTLTEPTAASRLNFDQYRKEIGPDPRVSLSPVNDALSRKVTLRPEGPAGHHFDPPNADAPGFVNTSYLLHLEGLDPAWTHQQMFAAIELRRMVDPNWTFSPPPPAGVDHTPPAWTLDLNLPGQRLEIVHGPLKIPAIRITRTNDNQVIEIDKQAAYGDASSQTAGFAELCTLTADSAGPRLIHRNLGKAGFEVLILRQTGTTSMFGPQIVASARYKADGMPVALQYAANLMPEELPLTPVLLSDAPGAQWALSAYDIGHVCFGRHIAPLSDAVATITNGELGFHTAAKNAQRLTSRDALADHPLGVHTYLAAVTLRPSDTTGRRVMLPQQTVMLNPVGRARLSPGAARIEHAALMAFAAPAQVILKRGASASSATFDLGEVGLAPEGDLLFRCRISALVSGTQNTLTLTFSTPVDQAQTVSVTLSGDELSLLQYIDIRISTDGRLGDVLRYTRDPAGVSASVNNGAMAGQVPLNYGAITLTVSGPDWVDMDVSMIPAMPNAASAWNWDWVFPPVATTSAETDGPAPMDSALRPDALRRQREAVLSPLGMSPAFSVTAIPD